MVDGDVSELTRPVLRLFFDNAIIGRGVAYADDGLAEVVEVSPGAVAGFVEGSRGEPYETAVRWSTTAKGIRLDDFCTCPMRGSCKHAVALVITAQRSRESPSTVRTIESWAWRRALEPITSAPVSSVDDLRPIALRLAVEHRRFRGYGSGSDATHAVVTATPVSVNSRGHWVQTEISWIQLAERPDTLELTVPAHREALGAMARGLSYRDVRAGAAVDLDTFSGAIWLHLHHVREAGVALHHTRAAGDVILHDEPAELAIDLSRGLRDSVLAQPVITVGGVRFALPHPRAGLAGTEAAFYVDDDGGLQLARFAAAIPAEFRTLALTDPIVVPAGDVDEFLSVAGRHLLRLVPVTSDDPRLKVRAPDPPALALRVAFVDTALAAHVRWGFAYPGATELKTLAQTRESGRDSSAERALLSGLDLTELPALRGLLTTPWHSPKDTTIRGSDVITLLNPVADWLRAQGVQILVDDDAPAIREATADPVVSIRVDDNPNDRDWFDLAIEVSVNDEKVLFASLFTALSMGQERLLLPSGAWIRLDRPEFSQLHRLIAEARELIDPDDNPAHLSVNRFQADWWDEFAQLGVIERQSERWQAAMRQMGQLAEPTPVEVPAGIDATLRDYQRDGLSWLAFLYEHQLGGVLADDMGLGKTLQTLASFVHLLQTAPEARFLVIAPTSVVDNWRRETERFAPGLSVATIAGTDRKRGSSLAEAVGDAQIVVTSYTLFRLEFEQYQQLDWRVLVLDEAQFVKNRQSKGYQCVRRLEAGSKIAITGTPMENSLMDLWSMLSIVAPGLYPDPTRFAAAFAKPIESGEYPQRLETLRHRIRPLMRRRTKEHVLPELPPKVEQVLAIELDAKHQRIYQSHLQRERQKVLGLAEDMDANRFLIFKSLTMMRQLALDPSLVDERYEGVGSAKLDHLIDQIVELVAEGHRALVFSQFTRFLAKVRQRLDEAGIEHAYLDGRTRHRDRPISAFKDGQVPVFCISLKAGGFGLNLTEADYCFVLDPWWNPAAEAQAIDRAHRIGQERSVMVYRYVSAGTIEDKVMELKARKKALFDTVVGDEDATLAGALSADDVRGLFS